MSDVHLLYLVRKPHDINGKLCSHDGRICINVPNYTEVTSEPVDTKDDSVRCYQVEVRADEVLEVPDGGVKKLVLWLGDTHSRGRPQDMLTLPITSLTSMGGKALDPQSAAATLFEGYSDQMKLAGVIALIPEDILETLPKGAAALKTWAHNALSASSQAAMQAATAKAG